jgi:hypothetical protein
MYAGVGIVCQVDFVLHPVFGVYPFHIAVAETQQANITLRPQLI